MYSDGRDNRIARIHTGSFCTCTGRIREYNKDSVSAAERATQWWRAQQQRAVTATAAATAVEAATSQN